MFLCRWTWKRQQYVVNRTAISSRQQARIFCFWRWPRSLNTTEQVAYFLFLIWMCRSHSSGTICDLLSGVMWSCALRSTQLQQKTSSCRCRRNLPPAGRVRTWRLLLTAHTVAWSSQNAASAIAAAADDDDDSHMTLQHAARGGRSCKAVGGRAQRFAGGCVLKVKNVGLCLRKCSNFDCGVQSWATENSRQHCLKKCKWSLELKTSCRYFLSPDCLTVLSCESWLHAHVEIKGDDEALVTARHGCLPACLSVGHWWDSITWETLRWWSQFSSCSWSELSLS